MWSFYVRKQDGEKKANIKLFLYFMSRIMLALFFIKILLETLKHLSRLILFI